MKRRLMAVVLILVGACGQEPLGRRTLEERVQILEDNRYIAGDIESLALRIDERDWRGVRWHLADTVYLWSSDEAVQAPADELVSEWQAATSEGTASNHLFSAPIVNVQGDRATAEFSAQMVNSPIINEEEALGHFKFVFLREDARTWKISSIRFFPRHDASLRIPSSRP